MPSDRDISARNLAIVLFEAAPRAHLKLRAQFRDVPPELVEDAVMDGILAILSKPPSTEVLNVAGFLRVVAARRLKNALRSVRREVSAQAEDLERWADADSLEQVRTRDEIERKTRMANLLFRGSRGPDLRPAIEEVLRTGGRTAEVAARHGVRREYLSRALNWMAREE